jgi:hypothetical protein
MDGVSSNVALATLAVLSYRLLFCSNRELNITAMVFCCACAFSVGQLVAAILGEHVLLDVSSVLAVPASIVSLVRLGCKHSILSEAARLACCQYTTWFAPGGDCNA